MNRDETNNNVAPIESVGEEEVGKEQIQQQTGEKGEGANYSVNLAIIGGLVGAGIGLLANPEKSKKIVKNLGESEFVKVAGNEFKKTAQELLANQAQSNIKQLAVGYINKIEDGMLLPAKQKDNNRLESNTDEESQSTKYEDIKEENKILNERLEKIEKMLDQLVEPK